MRVLLSNGVWEEEEAVGRIWLDVRYLLLNHAKQTQELLSLAESGQSDLSVAAHKLADKFLFLDANGRLYDDVRDVLLSGLEWRGGKLQLRRDSQGRHTPLAE